MRPALVFALLSLLLGSAAQAADIRYISDMQYIPVRSGAGNDYRVIHRGLPSGTRLTVQAVSKDKVWSKITTENGTSGWIRSQYLTKDMPAQSKLDAATKRAEQAASQSATLQEQLSLLEAERNELFDKVNNSDSMLTSVTEELGQLKQISGKSIQLDEDNRRLVVESEQLRSELEMLKAENQRLLDKLDSEDFINGALAVLLGVIITLVVPRLWPRRRKSSSWA